MEYWLLDVKRTVKVNGIDVAFDYINTYYNAIEAIKEGMFLSMNEEVLSVSVHKWYVNEKGEHDHSEDDDSIPYRYEKGCK